jgi:hypothetical protein
MAFTNRIAKYPRYSGIVQSRRPWRIVTVSIAGPSVRQRSSVLAGCGGVPHKVGG